LTRVALAAAVAVIGGLAWASQAAWRPAVAKFLESPRETSAKAEAPDHDERGHDKHEETASIALSPQARKNIGLQTGVVRPRDFDRSITVPAIVVERPGQTRYVMSAPMTGVVTGVHVARGEAVRSGKLLFTLRLTHEDLVQAQTEFLRTLGQLDVEERELARLEKAATGAVAGRVVLERQYERDKLQALLRAQREALRLHGLTEEQVTWITAQGKLLREVQVFAPLLHKDDSLHHESEVLETPAGVHPASGEVEEPHAHEQRFIVEELPVQAGQAVESGEALCTLADYQELYLEGRAFEQDAEALVQAAEAGRHVVAVTEGLRETSRIENLEIVFVSNQVEPQSRALHFYVALPNEVVRDAMQPDGRHFIAWKHKTGQRMQLRVPVERWQNVLVLPVDAVAQEGPEFYVFVQNGDRFERRPVHVPHRDQDYAVIANDGSVFPGETVAMNAAHQLQMAIKNQAGGGVDPHAGHNH
jgi:multidrug efflux pump subunit AcrA (membrane-fusion protein)